MRISQSFFYKEPVILQNVKTRLWKRTLKSHLFLPEGSGGKSKAVQFAEITDQQIFDHLLNPPAPWRPGQPYSMPDGGPELDRALRNLQPTKKFLDTFEHNLQNRVRPKNDVLEDDGETIREKGIKSLLMDVYWDFRAAASGGKALYPHKGRVLT